MRREGRSLRPPIFQKPFPVRCCFWASLAIQGVILARLAWQRRRQFRTNFGIVCCGFPESRSGLKTGDSGGSSNVLVTLIPGGQRIGDYSFLTREPFSWVTPP